MPNEFGLNIIAAIDRIMVTERKVIAMLAALERMRLYCAAFPVSPAAIRQPRLFKRGQWWLAILEPAAKDRICGIGATVETALRAFDQNYLTAFRACPPSLGPETPEC